MFSIDVIMSVETTDKLDTDISKKNTKLRESVLFLDNIKLHKKKKQERSKSHKRGSFSNVSQCKKKRVQHRRGDHEINPEGDAL